MTKVDPISIDSASDSKQASDDSDGALGIHKITSIPLMRHSTPFANLSAQDFSISIAELFGPLPTPPEILQKIPPIFGPNLDQKIHFPLHDLVETILDGREGTKHWRARDRAKGIVERAWAEVAAAEERLQNEIHNLRVLANREATLVGRRVKKMLEEERDEEEGHGARGTDRGQKGVRTDIMLN